MGSTSTTSITVCDNAAKPAPCCSVRLKNCIRTVLIQQPSKAPPKNGCRMRKRCPEHGQFDALVYGDAQAYTNSARFNKPGNHSASICQSGTARLPARLRSVTPGWPEPEESPRSRSHSIADCKVKLTLHQSIFLHIRARPPGELDLDFPVASHSPNPGASRPLPLTRNLPPAVNPHGFPTSPV
jgi:hypothetical protein